MTVATRSPFAALLLSLITPGLGHVYVGRIVPGLAFTGAAVATGSLGALSTVLPAASLRGVMLVASAWTILCIAAAFDAWRCGRAVRDWSPREYNRWYVYLLLASLALPSAANWAIAVREHVAQVFRVPSASMSPTIRPGARVIVNRLAYRTDPVQHGDIVVFANPNARHADFIKRVVALPGDIVEMREDELFINGRKLVREEAGEGSLGSVLWEMNGKSRYRVALLPPREGDAPPSTFAGIQVPNGHCFVLGDDRRRSIDSRQFGPVPLADLVGRVDRIWQPSACAPVGVPRGFDTVPDGLGAGPRL